MTNKESLQICAVLSILFVFIDKPLNGICIATATIALAILMDKKD